MDNFGQLKTDNPSPFKPRSLFQALNSERGSTEAPPAAGAPPVSTPSAASTPSASDTPAANPPAGSAPANQVKNWYEGLPDDMKNNPKVQKFKSVDDMAKSYLELQTLLGHNKVPIPKDENDKAAIAVLNRALGVPDAPDGYQLESPKIEGIEGVAFGADQFKQIMHKRNVPQSMAKGLMEDYVGLLQGIRENNIKNFNAAVEKAKAELVKEWGAAYEQKVKLAQAVMNKFSRNKEEFDHINALIGEDSIALRWLASVGENFSEGALGPVGNQGSRFTKTPAEAKAEYDKIMMDANDIYWAGVRNNQMVPESLRKERIAYVESLLKMQLGQAS